ncbi:MAG: VWA domain-containing protein [Kiritimatiellae bacterium]|nr:VWA domain-containing protein [Kiritimatiellia bacterium]
MAFDPSKFTVPTAKPLPVVFLLDVSGSMYGSKISSLNQAVEDMLQSFSIESMRETEIRVSVITFGSQVKLHLPFTKADEIKWTPLSADGGTPMGTALQMAKEMIEDKDQIPSRAYRPAVILVSDGQPNDSWEQPLEDFITSGRSSKCDRMALAIGRDADEGVLGKFVEGTTNPLFHAENAAKLKDFFKFVTMSVTVRSKSRTPNSVPTPADLGFDATKIATKASSQAANQDNGNDEEGYW